MILRKFKYVEYAGTPYQWSLDGLILKHINLLVGKNATGKTNAITKIAWLGNMLAGFQPQLLNSGNYDVEFEDDTGTYQYKLNLLNQTVLYEELLINDKLIFNRKNDGTGAIFSVQSKKDMNFRLWPNQLVVTSKKDKIQHPFLEGLAEWAEGQRVYIFSSKLGQDSVFLATDTNNGFVDPRNMNSVAGMFVKGDKEFPRVFRENIIDSMNKIGYELDTIEIVQTPGTWPMPFTVDANGLILSVTEKNSKTPIMQAQISQGMFRALSLIIQIIYNTLKNLSTTILIDDIGEGLDFDRSSRLIKLLVEIGENNNNIQLIMSTNDRFVMNNVPLEYWQVIQREGGECRVFNYQNSKEKFDEFEYTGLNNFDFLATDYINSEWEKS
jgi:AAA15 family ATPase/GTPase